MIALLIPTVEEEVEEEAEVENVTSAVKWGISLVHVNLVVEEEVEEGTVHLVVAVVRRRLGKYFHVFLFLQIVFFDSLS